MKPKGKSVIAVINEKGETVLSVCHKCFKYMTFEESDTFTVIQGKCQNALHKEEP